MSKLKFNVQEVTIFKNSVRENFHHQKLLHWVEYFLKYKFTVTLFTFSFKYNVYVNSTNILTCKYHFGTLDSESAVYRMQSICALASCLNGAADT
jgi:hypothetical protein